MSEPRSLGARDAACRFLVRPMIERIGDARWQFAARVAPGDRALFLELVAGVTRREITLDAVLAAFSKANIEHVEKKLKAVLRLAIYQMIYLDGIPDHAAVSESLKLIPSRKARGFANGILRQFGRESRQVADEPAGNLARRSLVIKPGSWFIVDRDILPDPAVDPLYFAAVVHSFPLAAAELIAHEYALDGATAIMSQANERSQATLRLCGPENEDQRCLEELLSAKATTEEGVNGRLIDLSLGVDPSTLRSFKGGDVTVQGPFAARIAPLLAPQPGERILDLCSPPGGKAIHLAELSPASKITAFAQDKRGAGRLESTLARCPRPNITVRRAPYDPYADGPYQGALLDVPCSNSGVLGRRPEARYRLDRRGLASLNKVQSAILRKALSRLMETPGLTRVVYATCSILALENGDLVRQTLAEHPAQTRIIEEISALPQGPWQDGGYGALIEVKGHR